MSDVNYESMCMALLTLLDRIEVEDDASLAGQRFDIAEEAGMTVEIDPEPISGAMH